MGELPISGADGMFEMHDPRHGTDALAPFDMLLMSNGASKIIGMIVSPSEDNSGCLVVDKILSDSLVAQWNDWHQADFNRQLQVGDLSVAIDGKRAKHGDVDELLSLMRVSSTGLPIRISVIPIQRGCQVSV